MNTIQPQIQPKYNNNNISFSALKGFQYCGYFNPHTDITDAKIVLALKKSETFKDFFKKYDCVARFGFWYSDMNKKAESYFHLKIFYKEKDVSEPEQNWLKRIGQNIKKRLFESSEIDLDTFDKEIEFNSDYIGNNTKDNIMNIFLKKIQGLSKKDLDEAIKKADKEVLEKRQKADLLKRLNEEIYRPD